MPAASIDLARFVFGTTAGALVTVGVAVTAGFVFLVLFGDRD